ncbi:MAG: hypothetical protein IIX25_00710, partial [Clostridia bacterium]|nr:hypothetical protein [Clostridia bacterium]
MKLFKPSSIKLLALIMAILAVLLLCACNKEDTDATDATNEQTETPSETSKYNDGKLRIFADGKYQCKIVRPENATRRELDFYLSVRNIFKEVTGVMPSIATDFIAHNESYDPNEFAILVGTTDHDEASELYSKLSYSDFRAELINKKYVLGFHDLDTANTALATLKTLLTQNFKNGEIILEGDWDYTYSDKQILEDVPVYEGGRFSNVYEGAYDMQTIVIEDTNENEYNAYLSKIAADGFAPYTDNSIGKNLFATYKSDKYILTAMYFDSRKEVRVTLEESGNYDLPALEVENVYTDKGIEATITQIGLEESTGVQNGMSYIIKLADGSFMIFDGGTGAGTGKA